MNPPATIAVGSNRTRPRRSARARRRNYADFRELLDLESEGKRVNFTSSHAPALPSEPRAPQLQQEALPFRELQPDPAWPDHPALDNLPAAPAEMLDPGFHPKTEAPVLIVVDQRMTMFYGSRQNMKSVIAAKAAALLAWRMLAQGKPVGALIFNDRKIVQLGPHCSRLRVILILHALLNQNHALLPNAGIRSNLGMLNEALRRTEQVARANSLVLLITDASGQDEETSRLASGISRDKRLLMALVYDPRQTQVRSPGSFIAENRNQGSQTGVRHSRETLHGTFGRQQPFGRRFFPDEIPIIPLNTRDDVADQMRRELRRLFLSPSLGISLSELHNVRTEAKERTKADAGGSPANWSMPPGTQSVPPAQPWQL